MLKAERFFKERRIPYQTMDLKKHKLGKKELVLFVRAAGGAQALVDRSSQKALERPAAHMSSDALIVEALLDDPDLEAKGCAKRNAMLADMIDVNAYYLAETDRLARLGRHGKETCREC